METTAAEGQETPFVADLIEQGDRELLVKTVEDAQNVITEFEQRTFSRFAVRTCIKNFGKTEVNLKAKRIFWDATSLSKNTIDTEVKYIPYAILGLKLFDCHYGKRTHPPKKNLLEEEDGGSLKRRRSQPTKKLGCPAKLTLRDVVYFPNYVINSDTKYYKEVTSRRLRYDWGKKDFVDFVRYIRISLPSQEDHEGHPTGEACGPLERIDPKVSKKIEELVSLGVDNVKDMKSHLELYVRKHLFPGRFKPHHTNNRFFPNKKAIKNKMYKTMLKRRFSKIDIDNLVKSVQEWSEQSNTDKFFFRPYSEVDLQLLKESTNGGEIEEDSFRVPQHISKQSLLFVHQTSFQQYLFHKYGNFACFLDATFRTIKYSLPLYFLVVKTNVDYQIVATIVVQDAGKESIQEALDFIKTWNPNVNPTVFFSGWDKEEIHAIQETYETCTVLICDFHRRQAWESWLSKAKNHVAPYKKAILVYLEQIANARTEEAFTVAFEALQDSEMWNANYGLKLKAWLENVWLPEKERWVWAYKKELFSITSTANNEHEVQAKDFKRDFLVKLGDAELSQMLKILIEQYLPEKENSYYKLNAHYKCSKDLPHFLHDRPKEVVRYLHEKIAKAALICDEWIEVVDENSGVFTVKSTSEEKIGHCVFFGSPETMPYCQCVDWENTLLPCEHFFAIMTKYDRWSWFRLPELYRSSPYLTLDRISPIRLADTEDSVIPTDQMVQDDSGNPQFDSSGFKKSQVVKAAACRKLIHDIHSLLYSIYDETVLANTADKLKVIITDLRLVSVEEENSFLEDKDNTGIASESNSECHKTIVKFSYESTNTDHDYQITNRASNEKAKIQAIPLNAGRPSRKSRRSRVGSQTHGDPSCGMKEYPQAVSSQENGEVIEETVLDQAHSLDEYVVDTCNTLNKTYSSQDVILTGGETEVNAKRKRMVNETSDILGENCVVDRDKDSVVKEASQIPEQASMYEEGLVKLNEFLTEESINLFHGMLKTLFPDIEGLQDAMAGIHGLFGCIVRGKKFIQLLHDGNFHWVCVSNISNAGIRSNSYVDLYDSFNRGYVPKAIQVQIASLLKLSEPLMHIAVQPVQQQINDADSGVFAIAFATTLAFDKDPRTINLDSHGMRQHILNCVQNGKLEPFPCGDQRKKPVFCKKKEISVELFCSCRMPHLPSRKDEDSWIQCKYCEEWFHYRCERIPKEMIDHPRRAFLCQHCSNNIQADITV